MPSGKQDLLERERRWSLPVALATLVAIGLLVAAAIAIRSVSGDGASEVLREADAHGSAITLSSALQAVAFVLLVMPLVYLFRAAEGRSPQMRGQLIGLVIAAPLFLATASVLNGVATSTAATDFLAGEGTANLTVEEARDECASEREDEGAAEFRDEYGGGGGGATLQRCATTKVADERAEDAIAAAPTRAAATGFALGGRLGLAFALLYSCLYAMRAGLLTRFWGALGMALGAAALLLHIQFTLIWFVYFALLVMGWLPGGRPPAWAAGEAVAWPTPGEKAATELNDEDSSGEEPRELDAGSETSSGAEPGAERRKRKQRD